MRSRLKYIEVVRPEAKEVQLWVQYMHSQISVSSCKDVVNAIYVRRAEWDSLVAQYKGKLETSITSWGRCFSHAVFMCAVCRALGYGRDQVFVAVTCHEGEPFERALHATVVLYEKGKWYCIDVTKPCPKEAFLRIGKLENLLGTNPYLCMFNDQKWQVAEE